MFALVTGFPLFAGLVKGSIYFLCLISVTPIMLLLSGRAMSVVYIRILLVCPAPVPLYLFFAALNL